MLTTTTTTGPVAPDYEVVMGLVEAGRGAASAMGVEARRTANGLRMASDMIRASYGRVVFSPLTAAQYDALEDRAEEVLALYVRVGATTELLRAALDLRAALTLNMRRLKGVAR